LPNMNGGYDMKIVNGKPMTNREQVKMYVSKGDYKNALKLTKAWKEDKDRDALVRGYECMTNPGFYKSIGCNVDECIESAKAILDRKVLNF